MIDDADVVHARQIIGVRLQEIIRLLRDDSIARFTVVETNLNFASRIFIGLQTTGIETVPTHLLTNLVRFVILTHGTYEKRIPAKPPKIPRHIERSTPQNGASIGKVIDKDFPYD